MDKGKRSGLKKNVCDVILVCLAAKILEALDFERGREMWRTAQGRWGKGWE